MLPDKMIIFVGELFFYVAVIILQKYKIKKIQVYKCKIISNKCKSRSPPKEKILKKAKKLFKKVLIYF